MKRISLVLSILLIASVTFATQTANVMISCNPNPEADLGGYYWYWNGKQVGNTPVSSLTDKAKPSWVGVVDMVEGDNFGQAAAYDVSGNVSILSERSNIIKVDTVAPSQPTGCSAHVLQ